jgi:hypothetical protein
LTNRSNAEAPAGAANRRMTVNTAIVRISDPPVR